MLMKIINDALKKYNLRPTRYEKNGRSFIVDTETGKYVVKPKADNQDIYHYLNSRSFHYYPKNISSIEDDYDIFRFIFTLLLLFIDFLFSFSLYFIFYFVLIQNCFISTSTFILSLKQLF